MIEDRQFLLVVNLAFPSRFSATIMPRGKVVIIPERARARDDGRVRKCRIYGHISRTACSLSRYRQYPKGGQCTSERNLRR